MPQVFNERVLECLQGHIAVGHCRYSTSGSSVWENAQPTFRPTATGGLALGHNGNLINTLELTTLLPAASRHSGLAGTSDTDVLTALFADPGAQSVWDSALAKLPLVRGAYSLVFLDERTLYAARDPQGFRPLVLGRLGAGLGGRERNGGAGHRRRGTWSARSSRVSSSRWTKPGSGRRRSPRPARAAACSSTCYLARPDTTIAGRGVQAARVEVGRRLAAEYPAEADLVIPVPESGTPAAIGYAQASGIPYGQGLVKNSYVGRTFIQPSQTIRQRGIRLKLNPLRDVIAGKRIVVVDDSIVRGNTQQRDRGDAARGRRGARSRAHLQPAGAMAVLLRDRLRQPRRADRRQPLTRADMRVDRRGLAGVHLARSADRGDHDARAEHCAGPASTATTRWAWPKPNAANTCWRPSAGRP